MRWYNLGMDSERIWHIYTLSDPRDNQVRYVGWSFNPRQRLHAHVSRARHGGSYKYHWIAQLLALSRLPVLEIVESGNGDWQEAERRWIATLKAAGSPLTNLTAGGDGTPGYFPSLATRAKMAAAQRGRTQTPESIAKTRAAQVGRKQSEAHRQKLGAIRKGRVPVAATAAAAAFWRGRRQTPEHVAKRMMAHIGRPKLASRKLSPEQVREIRAAQGIIPIRRIATMYGVGQTTIHAIQHRQSYPEIRD